MNPEDACSCATLLCNERKKRKALNLGVTKYFSDTAPKEDPIIDMFNEYTWSVNNTQTKQREQMSISEVINSQISPQDSAFMMFPPSVIPNPDLGMYCSNFFVLFDYNYIPLYSSWISKESFSRRTQKTCY